MHCLFHYVIIFTLHNKTYTKSTKITSGGSVTGECGVGLGIGVENEKELSVVEETDTPPTWLLFTELTALVVFVVLANPKSNFGMAVTGKVNCVDRSGGGGA